MKLKLSREFKIGFFGILMIAALYWGINFLKGRDLFTSSVHYYAVYDQVNGLQSSAAVLIKVIRWGRSAISKPIGTVGQGGRGIFDQVEIQDSRTIPRRGFSATGLWAARPSNWNWAKSAKYLQQGDTLFSEINKDFLEVAGSEFEFLKQRANDVINQLMITLGHINTLMADNKDNLNATFTNIASISGNLNEVIAGEKNNVREIVQNLNELSKTLSSKSGQIDRIVTNVENFSDSLSKSKIPTMIAQATTTLESLNTTLEKVNHGDGTVGRFLNDQALYDELVDATANLSALLEDLRTSRYINVSVFGRRNRDE